MMISILSYNALYTIINKHRMDLFKAALNNSHMRSQGFYNVNTMTNEEKLREQLYHCTYNDE